MTRRESREQCFAFIFESTFGNDNLEEIINLAKTSRNIEISSFCKKLFEGIKNNNNQIEIYIENNIKNWEKERISRTAMSVLKIAIYEMIFEKNIPHSVSINEAVELAKKYSTKEESQYINGVLSSIYKELNKNSEVK